MVVAAALAIRNGCSFRTPGMVIAPCSIKSLAEIAAGNASSLLIRAADVVDPVSHQQGMPAERIPRGSDA